jgi:preprotein translocase subunit YajC
MFRYLILAVVIVVLICLIYSVFINGDNQRRKKSEKLLNESAGVFDENAR